VLWLWVRFLDSGRVTYGLTCSKAYSLLNHAKPTQTIEATRLVFIREHAPSLEGFRVTVQSEVVCHISGRGFDYRSDTFLM
jgi:hypothetical protein